MQLAVAVVLQQLVVMVQELREKVALAVLAQQTQLQVLQLHTPAVAVAEVLKAEALLQAAAVMV
jgi:hypothetical protein